MEIENFIKQLEKLTTANDRYIKGASLQLLKKIDEVKKELGKSEN